MTDDFTPVADEPTAPAKEWSLDADARKRIDAVYEEIEAVQSGYPECVVCGQKVVRLDRFGTCSKASDRSEPHRQHRNEFKAGVRA